MTDSMILFVRPERRLPTFVADVEPTPLEIQRWEDDGGAVLADTARAARARCRCGGDYRQSAAA